MRYAFLAFRTLSRLDFISSRGISCMSIALWSFERKCSETAVGLEQFPLFGFPEIVRWLLVFNEALDLYVR